MNRNTTEQQVHIRNHPVHFFGVESSGNDSIYVGQTFVSLVVVQPPIHFHRQYMYICELSGCGASKFLSFVRSSTPGHVSTNGCLESWQCSLFISMLFQACPGPEFDATLFGAFPYDVHSTRKFHACHSTRLHSSRLDTCTDLIPGTIHRLSIGMQEEKQS